MLNRTDVSMLVLKLPGSGGDRWFRKALAIRRKDKREPDMMDFIQFVNDNTVIVTNPIFLKK